jgi:predicted ATPase
MHIVEIQFENFLSLRKVAFRPRAMTVIVGPNGSGKSNIASAFEFISTVYTEGLSDAVRSKGGFENIAFRSQRRTRSAVRFAIEYEVDDMDLGWVFRGRKRTEGVRGRIKHSFAIRASQQSIRSDYRVVEETLEVLVAPTPKAKTWEQLFKLTRQSGAGTLEAGKSRLITPQLRDYLTFISEGKHTRDPDQSLFFNVSTVLGRGPGLLGISVHQFSPQSSRLPSPAVPRPRMGNYGEHLAAVVDWLRRHHERRWHSVEKSMREIIPGLETIKVEFSSNRQLTLAFKEDSSARPWTSNEVSDGTIQTLSILCCLADPRTTILFLEEIENSVHPWIVRQLAKQLKEHAAKTQTILTTHSPIILNMVEPTDVWVCFKNNGETQLAHLPVLNPDVVKDWEAGTDRLFDIFDMGLVREAVPRGQLR